MDHYQRYFDKTTIIIGIPMGNIITLLSMFITEIALISREYVVDNLANTYNNVLEISKNVLKVI